MAKMTNESIKVEQLPVVLPFEECFVHIPRGVILSGVLDGTASYDVITPYTDGDSGNLDSSVEYDPNSDQRLDKFDALEEGYQTIDAYDSAAGGSENHSVEKKE